jgi:hypothetical protein
MAEPYSYFRAHGSMAERLVPEFCGRHNSDMKEHNTAGQRKGKAYKEANEDQHTERTEKKE